MENNSKDFKEMQRQIEVENSEKREAFRNDIFFNNNEKKQKSQIDSFLASYKGGK